MTKMQVRMITEILGRPKDYIEDAAKKLVAKLEAEKGVKMIEKSFHDAVPVQGQKDLFTTFIEVTVELDSVELFFAIIYAYMPANIEIIHPENISISSKDLNYLGNKLIQKMHEYDAIVKRSLANQEILTNHLKEVAPHLFKQPAAKEEPKQAQPAQQVKPAQEKKKVSNKTKKQKKN